MPRGRGFTKVDLRHLLEDLRDAYPAGLEETILTELVANSLDAGASSIRVFAEPAGAKFRLEDDGRGMVWKELRRFHDLAASTKTRGDGIGFAGVGIKLALLAADEVVTESRRGKSHAASRWRLASREFAPYEPIPPPGHVAGNGTSVSLHLHHGLSPLLDAGFLEHVLRTHYQPLFEPEFAPALASIYPKGIRFELNGRTLGSNPQPAVDRARLEVRIERQRKASGSGYVERHPLPLAEPLRGIAVSTYGKVIRRGWDWLGILPTAPDRISGILEVPSLAQSLTLNKGDFVRTGPRGALYLSYRRVIQEAVQAQLTLWGDARDEVQAEQRRIARPLERDLERVLEGLTEAFPLLASLVERQQGGQRRIALACDGEGHGRVAAMIAEAATAMLPPVATAEPVEPATKAPAEVDRDATLSARPFGPTEPPVLSGANSERDGEADATTRRARTHRYGLSLQFEARPGDIELGRLIENTVWINTAHPAYLRAESTRSTGYHVAVTVALAIAPLATGGAGVQRFLTEFLSQWGEAVQARSRQKPKGR